MTPTTYKLYLIKVGCLAVGYQTVAIIPAKGLYDSINKYLAQTGFASPHVYFCNYLMTNTVTFDTGTNNTNEYCFIIAIPKTAGDDYPLRISSQQATSCDDIFALVDYADINNPLFIRPAIEKVRNCVGFSKEPESELRKFCI